MILNMNMNSRETSLNFKIIGGTTQPTNPTENMIWVNTDVDISSWTFSVEEPSNPVESMVWFNTDRSSLVEFNALKENTLHVYPCSSYQYIDNIWTDVVSYTYQNGEWSEWWTGQLFDNGNQWKNVTGGWTDKGYTFYDYGWDNTESKYTYVDTVISGKIYLANQGALSISCAATKEKVDLTKYNTLFIQSDYHSNGSYALEVYINTNKRKIDYGCALTQSFYSSGEKSIDISGLQGSYYIYLHLLGTEGATAEKIEISKVWLEE